MLCECKFFQCLKCISRNFSPLSLTVSNSQNSVAKQTFVSKLTLKLEDKRRAVEGPVLTQIDLKTFLKKSAELIRIHNECKLTDPYS